MSEIKFNNFSTGYNLYNDVNKETKKEETVKEQVKPENKPQAEAKDVLDAMSYLGAQNLVNVSGKISVDPAKYLSDERIASIEESMALFEQEASRNAGLIKEEFGGLIDDKTALTLGANVFANQLV